MSRLELYSWQFVDEWDDNVQDTPMDGLLLIDKPSGMTSHDVVDAVRRIAKTRAVGHAGTLDPFATGLLILGINKATKWLTAMVGLDKTYEATLTLGATSDSFDCDGVITPWSKPLRQLTVDDIEPALQSYRGTYEQLAPLFSAKKIQGKKLYDLARAGTATESMRPRKLITVHALSLRSYIAPELALFVHCSSGTYIRSLADDLGRSLDVGAYLSALRRTSIGPYPVTQSVALNALTTENWSQSLITQQNG